MKRSILACSGLFVALATSLQARKRPRPIGSKPRRRPSPTATTGPRRSRCCASRRATSSTSTRCSRTRRRRSRAPACPTTRSRPRSRRSPRRSRRAIPNRGPGGHILTGPVFVEGAEPGDALEVKMLSIDLPIDYGYNGCSGFVPGQLRPVGDGHAHDDPQARSQDDDVRVPAGHRHSAEAVLRQHGRGAGAGARPRQQQSAGQARRQSRQRELVAGSTLYIPVFVPGALFEDRRRPRRAGRRRSGSDRDRNVAARPAAAHRAQGHDAHVAARGNRHRLHRDGHRSRI